MQRRQGLSKGCSNEQETAAILAGNSYGPFGLHVLPVAVLYSCAGAASRHARTSGKRRRTHAAGRNVARVSIGVSYRAVQNVIRQFGLHLGGNSWFVLAGATLKCLVPNDGDVAERLKAAVC